MSVTMEMIAGADTGGGVLEVLKLCGFLTDLFAVQFWTWALERGIFLIAKHIAGKENVTADQMSHVHRDQADWMLNQEVFKSIDRVWSPLEIDLLFC